MVTKKRRLASKFVPPQVFMKILGIILITVRRTRRTIAVIYSVRLLYFPDWGWMRLHGERHLLKIASTIGTCTCMSALVTKLYRLVKSSNATTNRIRSEATCNIKPFQDAYRVSAG